jgi:nucleoside-diphosphate-sugar epimerase
MLAIQGMAYQKQYGFNSIHLIPSNLYGPHDCFDEYRSHVVGALIRKFIEAQRNGDNVVVWGTGKAIREFLYVEDCADGILLATEKVNETLPVNIGTGVGTSIKELVETIVKSLSFKGKVIWDSNKPDGQAVKILDTTRMKSVLNWQPGTDLKTGVAKTLDWYQQAYPHNPIASVISLSA